MKRRIFLMAVLSLVFVTSGFAQFQRSIFNHVGLNVGAGTEGINVGVAAPLTNYLELEAGVSLMPSIKANADVDLHSNVSLNVQGVAVRIPDATVNTEVDIARTTFNVKAHLYPFGGNSKFFLAGGFSFGNPKIAKLSGHSDEIERFANQYPAYKQEILDLVSVGLADYNVKLDDNFDIHGDIRCNSFRPYLGLGFGRLVPKKRVGVRVELGCQFMGTLKVYQNDEKVEINKVLNDTMGDDADDISKFIEDWKYYPVLKLQAESSKVARMGKNSWQVHGTVNFCRLCTRKV